MALLVAQQTTDLGTPIVYDAADESGDSVAVTADTVVHIKNGVAIDEQQTLTVTGTPTGGTFTLELIGEGNGWAADETTANIDFDATAGEVEAALEALNKIVPGDVEVTGGPLPGDDIIITFTGAEWGGRSVIDLDPATAFTGGTTPSAEVEQTTAGHGLCTVTVEAHEECNQGSLHHVVVAVAPDTGVFIGPFSSHLVQSGEANWAYSDAAGVEVAALLV